MNIGIFTSGGESPGMNALLFHLYNRLNDPHHVIFFAEGIQGVLRNQRLSLTEKDLYLFARQGGSLLGTSRFTEDTEAFNLNLLVGDIDLFIVLGGDGSLRFLSKRIASQIPVIAIPCSIDNDIPHNEASIGFHSACDAYLHLYEGLVRTAMSLKGRVFILETLGGNTGVLARSVGQTLQADAIVIPEIMISAKEVATRLNEAVEQKGYGIGVINESVNTEAFREILESHLAYRVRYSQPSHAIRGCNPTFFDLTLAKMFAQHVTSLISQYKQSHVLLYQKGRVCSMPLSDFA